VVEASPIVEETLGVHLRPRAAIEVVSLAARRGQAGSLAARIRETLGVELPFGPRRTDVNLVSALGVGPERWLLVHDGADGEFANRLARDVAGLAAVCVQSDAYVVVRVSGPRARDALAKGVSVDLHPRVFGNADVAVTQAAHVGLVLWQIDEAPTYDLAVFRSYERNLLSWLRESAAEFGVRDELGGR
jgi:methylglutamate dehydrogenase subunit D